MPKIFNRSCKKVDISLLSNTITVYRKNCPSSKFKNQMETLEKIGFCKFIFSHDEDHKKMHQDNFTKVDHTHLQFSNGIDEQILEKFLTLYVQSDIISEFEKFSFMQAFIMRNQIISSLTNSQILTQGFAGFFAEKNHKAAILECENMLDIRWPVYLQI